METFKGRLLVQLNLLLFASPLIATQEDSSCDCVDKCVVWIVVAAIIPPLIIVGLALTLKWCSWLNRHRKRVDGIIDKPADEPSADPVNDFENPNQRSPPNLPTRRRTEHSRIAETQVSSRFDVVTEGFREESGSDLNNPHSKSRRKKQRKLTDLGKASKSKTVEVETDSHESERGNMGNMCLQKKSAIKKVDKSNTINKNIKAFTCIEDVQDIESEADTFTISDSENYETMAIDRIRNKSDNNKELDEAIHVSSNAQNDDESYVNSDVETSELQVLKDDGVTEHHSITPSIVAEYSELSRPNSPVPNEEIPASGVSRNHTETLQRSSTPFPFFRSKPQSKRKAIPKMAESIIEEIDEEQTEKQLNGELARTHTSRTTDNNLSTNNVDAGNLKNVKDSDKSFKDEHLSQNILTRRAMTPTPTSTNIPPKDVTKRRSKTPDPQTKSRGKPRIIHVTEKKQSSSGLFNSGLKEIIPNPSRRGDSSVSGKGDSFETKSAQPGDRQYDMQMSNTSNSTNASQSKPHTYNSKYDDPFVTDYSHSHRHNNQATTQGNVDSNHSFQTNSEKPYRNLTEQIYHHGDLGKPHSEVKEVYNPAFLNRRSKTPDPFGTQIGASKEEQSMEKPRSKTPDPFITTKHQTSDSHTKFSYSARSYSNASKEAKNTRSHSDKNTTDAFSSQLRTHESYTMHSRSTTPDPFANRFSARMNKEYDKVRSKTPDQFTKTKFGTTVSEKGAASEQRLDHLLKTSSTLKGKSDIQTEHGTLKDESLSRLIRDASRRAATPDPELNDTDGLTYNTLFATGMRRSKSVNTSDKPGGKGKLLSYRGSEKRRNYVESRIKDGESFSGKNDVSQDKQFPNVIKPKSLTFNTDTIQPPSLPGRSPNQHDRAKNKNKSPYDMAVIDNDQITEDNRLTGKKEDTFDKILNTIDGHVKSAQALADSAQRQLEDSTKEPVSEDPDASVIQSTAAKLRARRQIKLNDMNVLEDELHNAMAVPDLKPKTILHGEPFHRSTFSLQGVLKEKPASTSASPPPSVFDQSRDNARSQETTDSSQSNSDSRTPSLGNRNATYAIDNAEKRTRASYTSIHRAKSPNERKLFDVEPFAATEEEARRKRKHSSLKVQLPDLAASPKKSILKKPVSPPPTEGNTGLGLFPLSQFVSSAKYGRDNLPDNQPTKVSRSIMFASSPTTFGGTAAWGDTIVQRSHSHNERRHRTPSLRDRPPTPAVSGRTMRKQNWNMSSTKL